MRQRLYVSQSQFLAENYKHGKRKRQLREKQQEKRRKYLIGTWERRCEELISSHLPSQVLIGSFLLFPCRLSLCCLVLVPFLRLLMIVPTRQIFEECVVNVQ